MSDKINGKEIELQNGSAIWVGQHAAGDSCCIRFARPAEGEPIVGTYGPADLAVEDGKQLLRLRISMDAAYALHALLGDVIARSEG